MPCSSRRSKRCNSTISWTTSILKSSKMFPCLLHRFMDILLSLKCPKSLFLKRNCRSLYSNNKGNNYCSNSSNRWRWTCPTGSQVSKDHWWGKFRQWPKPQSFNLHLDLVCLTRWHWLNNSNCLKDSIQHYFLLLLVSQWKLFLSQWQECPNLLWMNPWEQSTV